MDRKLIISFCADRSVDYLFHRNDEPLSSYTLDHPAEQVVLLEADPGYQSNITPEGWIRLSWKKNPTIDWSGIHYRKLEKLIPVYVDGRDLLRFDEDIRITSETNHGLWLGSPSGPLSVVRALSTAVFLSDDGHVVQFEARHLTEEVFHSSGVLQVRWVLEPMELQA